MPADFINALREEIGDLEKALAADPRHMKLRELRRVEALYAEPTRASFSTVRTSASTGRSPSPERIEVLKHVAQFLAGRSAPTPTAELYEAISLMVNIPGASPRNNLSAMLSNSPDFRTHGRSGWTLVSKLPEAPDDLISRSASEASTSSPASPAGEPSTVRPVDPEPGGGT